MDLLSHSAYIKLLHCIESHCVNISVELNCVPQKRYILAPESVTVTFGNSLCICNQVQMRSYSRKVGPNPVTSVLMRRGRLGPGHTGETAV